jgi:ABC-type sugar transport system ATPase subunit
VALLQATHIHKSYPGARALAGVDLSAEAGEVHALLGENGAGKSTLMKVIAGSEVPDSGDIRIDGEPLPLGSPESARRSGVGIVYQDLSLVPSLSVGENVLLGRWPQRVPGVIDWSALHEQAQRHLDRIGLGVDVHRPLVGLGMAERQLVEIAKALSNEARVLLLDDPTSALSERESSRLFDIIRALRSSQVAVVYVSHRLTEVLDIADRITVLRDGQVIDTVSSRDVAESDLARMMVGRDVDTEPTREPQHAAPEDEELALEAIGLARPPRLKPIHLQLRRGEILGVFGLVGAGRTRLARTLFGLEPPTEGSLKAFGREARISSPADAIAHGLGYLGEDRSTGIVPRMDVTKNVTLASLDRVCRGAIVDRSKEVEVAQGYVDDLSIRTASLDQLVDKLSGGNQQKVVLARWLCSNARILILDDPTRGIDVGAKEEVFRLVRKLANEGIAILYLTSEIREARALADRMIIMSDGRIVASAGPETSEDEIMASAGGVGG